MTGKDYQWLAARTINPRLSKEQMKNHALHGMVSEIGEIHGLYQKAYQGHYVNEDHLVKELGDLMWFIAEFCTSNDWNLDAILDMNIDKLVKRYPDGFETDRSLHRDKNDI